MSAPTGLQVDAFDFEETNGAFATWWLYRHCSHKVRVRVEFFLRYPTATDGVVCRDEGSARQYAVMLNEAWRLGYKAGFREGRQAPG